MPDLDQLWPFFSLRLSTPRLRLSYAADSDLAEVVARAQAGIHAPERMPFGVPWTLADPEELGPQTLQYFWRMRVQLTADDWDLPFVVRRDGAVVGIQTIRATRFSIRRTATTGSWLGREFQGQGIGTEMRAAVVAFAFDWLGATRAESGAFMDNPASRAVSARLGYAERGIRLKERREGEAVEHVDFVLTPSSFVRPSWTLQVDGLDACRARLGISRPA